MHTLKNPWSEYILESYMGSLSKNDIANHQKSKIVESLSDTKLQNDVLKSNGSLSVLYFEIVSPEF